MTVTVGKAAATTADYEAAILKWRAQKDEVLTADDGWLALIGLFWLEQGANTIGRDPTCNVPLPAPSVPEHFGVLTLQDGTVRLDVQTRQLVTIDGVAVTAATLRDDTTPGGPTIVRIGTVSFFIIRRGDNFGVRARDTVNPARTAFEGRHWFALNPALRVPAIYTPHETPRWFAAMTSAGIVEPIKDVGRVDFEIDGKPLALEAFDGGDELWFIFRDSTSGKTTYGGGRFLYNPLDADGRHLTLDFNKAYFPPCAFTPYAACPLPPPENHLPISIKAGERK